jgi:diaminopimelate decarboxylase
MSQQLSKEQLIDIAKEFGTPVYIYHAEKIEEQLNELNTAFKDCKAKFFYAAKH